MKPKLFLAALLLCLITVPISLFGQGTAFSYQGRLTFGTSAANGVYDFQFAVYDSDTAGNAVGNPVTNTAVWVSNGVFTVQLDFGAGIFDGNARWLEIGVETNGDNSFTTLTPRQPVMPAPYAMKAANATLAASANSVSAANIVGTLGNSQLPPTVITNGAAGISVSGSFAGSGAALGGLNPFNLTGIASVLVPGAAVVTNLSEAPLGNGFGLAQGVTVIGNYVYLCNGYNDGLRVFSLANPASPQPVAHLTYPDLGTGGALMLAVSGNFAYLANGYDGIRVLSITNPSSPVVVGHVGSTYAQAVAVSGSKAFVADTGGGLIVLDISNPSSPTFQSSGGVANVWSVGASGPFALAGTLTSFNVVSVPDGGFPSVIGTLPESAMGNGRVNGMAVSGSYVYLANDQGGFVIVDISTPTAPVVKARIPFPTVKYPYQVTLYGTLAYVAEQSGGIDIINVADPANPFVIGNVTKSAMNGGTAYGIDISYPYAYVANNTNALSVLKLNMALTGNGSQITNLNAANISGVIDSSHLPAGLITNNQSGVALGGTFTGTLNGNGSGVTSLNASQLTAGVVPASALSGFQSPNYQTVGGGLNNTASDQMTTVGGGQNNSASGTWATVAGGINNNAGSEATVGGGGNNHASGVLSTVPGGQLNTAAGFTSFAAGNNAQANNDGSFVWADSVNAVFASSANNQFSARAGGGVRFVTSGAGMNIDGNIAVGSTTVVGTSSVGIGTSSPQAPLHIHTGSGAPALRFSETANSSYWFAYIDTFNNGANLIFKNNSGQYMGIAYNNGAVYSSSDARLKSDIVPLQPVLDRVLRLQPVSYYFTNNPVGAPKTLGLLAQEVEPIFPEVVQHHDGLLGLSYTELVPVTVKAIQDLNEKLVNENRNSEDRIQKLESQNVELKQENESMEKRLAALEKMIRDQHSTKPARD